MQGLAHRGLIIVTNMKNWWESKAVWAGLGLIGLGLMHYYKTGDIVKSTELILTALGIIGIRVGNTKIQ